MFTPCGRSWQFKFLSGLDFDPNYIGIKQFNDIFYQQLALNITNILSDIPKVRKS